MSTLNTRLHLAEEYVQFTNKNIFLTGKAGTGKTTFLRNLKKSSNKRIAVVAPTGVAAINAGGVTIHSFFQISFGPFIPNLPDKKEFKYSSEKIRTIRGLDLLVIDEISMVRADLLDAIDAVLRKFRNRFKPFGGVQLLMIGDLHQLAPVAKEQEWNLLKEHYSSIYFFDSLALKQSDFITIELTHIYRQSDEVFINLLNQVRDKKLNQNGVELLNARYRHQLKPEDTKGYIHLTTHNYSAQSINKERLDQLNDNSHFFKADITGDFPEHMYPNDANLELKVGAQVMFVRNDPGREKLYFNGKLGVIRNIEDEIISVKGDHDEFEVQVSRSEWQNIKYTLNEYKEMTEQIVGSFIQFPLKTAWAITIHKSQGLTFEHAIIDAQASFAHGQVYVALSRCKSLEGLILSSPISSESIKSDETIHTFNEATKEVELNESGLNAAKRQSQIEWINDLFDFSSIRKSLHRLAATLDTNQEKVGAEPLQLMSTIIENFYNGIDLVVKKFATQLPAYYEGNMLPEENEELQERIKKGSVYLADKLSLLVYTPLERIDLDTDNKEITKSLEEIRNVNRRIIFEKKMVLDACTKNGFETVRFLQAKANAAIDYENVKNEKKKKTSFKPGESISGKAGHQSLYQILKEWRDAEADDRQINRYQILSQKTLKHLSEELPGNLLDLSKIHGIGKIKLEQFGEQLISIIKEFSESDNLSLHEESQKIDVVLHPKLVKGETQKLSYALFKEGLSIPEIAQARKLSVSTIETHFIQFVKNGSIDIRKIMSGEKADNLVRFLMNNSSKTMTQLREDLGAEYSYGEIRLGLASLGL